MPKVISRRSALNGLGVGTTVALAGCLGSIGGGGGASGPITVGVALPLSGPQALVGQEDKLGLELAKEYLDGTVLGEDIELVYRDTQTKPSNALQVTKSLVEEDEVDVLAGLVSSASGIAALPYIKNEAQIPQVFCQVGTPNARENSEFCTRYGFYPWAGVRQQVIANVNVIANEVTNQQDVDNSEVHFIGLDYEAGQTTRDMLRTMLGEEGIELTGATMIPQGESDLAPYLTEVEQSSAEVVSMFMPGSPAVQIMGQGTEFGIKNTKAMVFSGGPSTLAIAGAGESAKGFFGAYFYDFGRENEINQTFKEMYRSSVDKFPPNAIAVGGFNALYSIAQGLEEAGSRNKEDLINALEGLTFGSPMGEMTYRAEDHQTLGNFLGFEIVDGPGDGWDWSQNVFKQYPGLIGPAMCTV